MPSPDTDFRKDSSSTLDSVLVLAIGVATVVLCAFLIYDPELTILMLFLIGIGYFLAIGYFILICYLFVRMLWRRDAWLLYFIGLSATFVFFTVLVLFGDWGGMDSELFATEFMFVGGPYSILSVVFGISMLDGRSRAKSQHPDDT